MNKASYLSLLSNAVLVLVWNTIKIGNIVDQLQEHLAADFC